VNVTKRITCFFPKKPQLNPGLTVTFSNGLDGAALLESFYGAYLDAATSLQPNWKRYGSVSRG
jgi:hypothetical protein